MMLKDRKKKTILTSMMAEQMEEGTRLVVETQIPFKMTEEIRPGQEGEIRLGQENVIRLDQILFLTKPKEGHRTTTVLVIQIKVKSW